MRTSKTVSISMPPSQFKLAERLAKSENRTISELMREALRRYIAESSRQAQLDELRQAVEALRLEVRSTPAGKLTPKQLDKEIKAARQARRRTMPSR